MSYATQFAKVKKVFMQLDAGGLNRVMVKGGRIYATDDRMVVSTPFDCELEFCVNGKAFGNAIARPSPSLHFSDDSLHVTSGDAVLTMTSTEVEDKMRPSGDWIALPKNLIHAFEALHKFQSQDVSREWACAITIKDRRLYATNNFVYGVWEEEDAGDLDVAFPAWVVAYVMDLGLTPVGMVDNETWIGLNYDDGTELLAFKVGRKMPESAIEMGKSIEKKGDEIQPGWKSAVIDACSLPGTDTLKITPDEITTSTSETNLTIKIDSPTSKDCLFSPELILPVLGVATHIDLEAAPAPSTWYGHNIRGLIAGKV